MSDHPVVSHDAWLGARTAFLAKEKEFTRLRDELSRQRRALPWEAVDKPYVFDGPRGKQTLAELFGPRSQLVVYHFMFAPEWDAGCKSCSFWADNFNGIDVHLAHRDVSFVAISRAPLAKIDAFQRRMGWSFPWLSSSGSDFNYDFYASFTPEENRKGTAFFNDRKPLVQRAFWSKVGLPGAPHDGFVEIAHVNDRVIEVLQGPVGAHDVSSRIGGVFRPHRG
jgi:predicted dithiol-disulfide oxidoreductase (DUF899 family)